MLDLPRYVNDLADWKLIWLNCIDEPLIANRFRSWWHTSTYGGQPYQCRHISFCYRGVFDSDTGWANYPFYPGYSAAGEIAVVGDVRFCNMKVINSYYIFSSLASNITKHCTTANAPILRFKRFLRTPEWDRNRVCPYKRTSEQITYATQGWFSTFYNSLVTIHLIVIGISYSLDLTVCHRWKSGGTPRPLYRLRYWANSILKGLTLVFYHGCRIGVKR